MNAITRLIRREDGSYTIELAIIFPVLVLLFVGTAELGRLFYTYTTLSVGSSRVDLQACKLEYSIVSPK